MSRQHPARAPAHGGEWCMASPGMMWHQQPGDPVATALEAGEADALAVYRLDRLSRKLAYQEVWRERLEAIGCQVVSVTEPEHGEDEMRNLVRQILGAVAEYERVVIVKRLQGGRAAKHARGGYAYGSPPYGWKAEGKELVADDEEQAVRRAMAAMRRDGLSYQRIAEAMNAQGRLPLRGQCWYAQTVSRALARNGEIAAGGAR